MPSWSNATPVVAGTRLFVLSEPTTLLAVDTRSGQILWSRDVTYLETLSPSERTHALRDLREAEGIRQRIGALRGEARVAKREAREGHESEETYARLEEISRELEALTERIEVTARHDLPDIPFIGYSSATPVTDGAHVYVVFGNGVAAAFDLDGQARWTIWIGPPHEAPLGYKHGQTSSPLLVGDRLIVGLGRLTALDTRTGSVLWRGPEYPHYGTPRSTRVDGRDVVITPAGEVVDVASGEVVVRPHEDLWFVGPVIDGDRVYFVGNTDVREVRARAFDLRSDGGRLAWTAAWDRPLEPGQQLTEPLVHGGLLYTVNADARLVVLATTDGRTVYGETLPLDEVYSGLTLAGGLLFITDQFGTTLAVRPGRTFEQVARSEVPDGIRSSLVFVEERLYLRSLERLHAIGADEPAP